MKGQGAEEARTRRYPYKDARSRASAKRFRFRLDGKKRRDRREVRGNGCEVLGSWRAWPATARASSSASDLQQRAPAQSSLDSVRHARQSYDIPLSQKQEACRYAAIFCAPIYKVSQRRRRSRRPPEAQDGQKINAAGEQRRESGSAQHGRRAELRAVWMDRNPRHLHHIFAMQRILARMQRLDKEQGKQHPTNKPRYT